MTSGRASRLWARCAAPSASHPALRYTALRTGLFLLVLLLLRLLVSAGVLPLAGLSGGVLLLGLAALISAPLSYLLFARHRDALALSIKDRFASIGRNIDESARSEDDDAA